MRKKYVIVLLLMTSLMLSAAEISREQAPSGYTSRCVREVTEDMWTSKTCW